MTVLLLTQRRSLTRNSCVNTPSFIFGFRWRHAKMIPSTRRDRSGCFLPRHQLVRTCNLTCKDDAANGVIAMRTKKVVVIVDFLEHGVHAQISSDHFAPLRDIPLQFQELVATIVYGAKLLCQETNVTFFQTDGGLAYTVNCRPTTEGDAVMNPWVKKDYAEILSYFTQIPVDQLYFPGDFVMSWLRNPQSEFVYWQLGTPHPFSGQTPTGNGS